MNPNTAKVIAKTNSKRKLITALVLLTSFSSYSQISFGPEVIINPNADNARWVDVVDMDGDGDMDVVSASQNDNRIAWYENDGSENFTQHDLTTTLDKACGVVTADFDGDGDIDVAASSVTNITGKVVWFQNDGFQNFTMIDIQTNLDRVHSITKDDIDGDGDMDLLAPIRDAGQLKLYKNDGLGNFTMTTIITGLSFPRTIWAEDIDGDGDRDITYQSMLSAGIFWGENDGSENFTQHTVSMANIADTKFVSAGDMDGDGDIDLLSASAGADRISLHRNDGSQNFTQELITGSELNPFCIVPVDLDFDGDLDLLAALSGEDHFAWYVNDGTGNFGPKNIISGISTCDGANYIMPEDLDGDGDIDAIVTADTDDDVSWFNPIVVLPVEDLEFQGEQFERYIDLYWTTQSEINNDYFDVERSIDGQNYTVIGQVDGHGNTTNQQYYSLIDNDPNFGMNYYRLRQVDYNGQYKYSNIIAFEYRGEKDELFISSFPNPTNGATKILFNAAHKGNSVITIYNSVGKMVFTQSNFVQEGLNAIEIDLTSIANGVYHLMLEAEQQEPRTIKLLKN